jgi:hypothetical protein
MEGVESIANLWYHYMPSDILAHNNHPLASKIKRIVPSYLVRL